MRPLFRFTHREARLVFQNKGPENREAQQQQPKDGEKKSGTEWDKVRGRADQLIAQLQKLQTHEKATKDDKRTVIVEKIRVDQSVKEMEKFIKEMEEGRADIVRGLDAQLKKLEEVLQRADQGRVTVEKNVQSREGQPGEPGKLERVGTNEWKVVLKPGQRRT